jgi:WD40 repeat protein
MRNNDVLRSFVPRVASSGFKSFSASFQAHDEPVRAVCHWNANSTNGSSIIATASKDLTIKCWNIDDVSEVHQVASLTGTWQFSASHVSTPSN